MATIFDVINQWQKALRIEAKHLESQGGSKHVVSDGRCLTQDKDGALYWFMLTTDLFLPDGTPVRLQVGQEFYQGYVISVQGFDVILKMNEFLGENISQAHLFSEPYELLLALEKRLDEAKNNTRKQKRMHRFMAAHSAPQHPKEKVKNELHELYLRAKYNKTTFVWGPPGTGKTYNLARMAAYLYKKGAKILILTHSNQALDVLLTEMATFLKEKSMWKIGDVIRYGYSTDKNLREQGDLLAGQLVEKSLPSLREQQEQLEKTRQQIKLSYRTTNGNQLAHVEEKLKKIRGTIKREEELFAEKAVVLGTTLSKAAVDPLIYEQTYDLVIVDEASMAYIPQLAFAGSLGKHVVICGDFKQLPPIATANHKLVNHWLKRDVFEATGIVKTVENGKKHPNLFVLTKQRRMHPEISSFTNQFIYQYQVSDHPTVRTTRESIARQNPFPNQAAIQVDLSRMGAFSLKEYSSDSRFNLFSAVLSLQFILEAKNAGLNSIGFITPYKAQARLMTELLNELIPTNLENINDEKIIAATVHKFQGSERDLIIFDTVDSYPQTQPGILLTDKDSEKLVNVAVTRARGKLIHISDQQFIRSRMSNKNTTRKLNDHLSKQHKPVTRYDLSNILTKPNHPNLQWFNQNDDEKLLQDILNAKKVFISASFPKKVSAKLWKVLKQIEHKATITVASHSLDGIPLKRFSHIPRDLVMPFIEVDDEILWLGTPIMETNFESAPKPPYLKARLVSKNTIQLLHSYLTMDESNLIREVKAENTPSIQTTSSLTKYISSWDQCPACRSIRKIEVQPDGDVRLQCDHCGQKGRVVQWFLQKYLDYADVNCPDCHRPLEAVGSGKDLAAVCEVCYNRFKIKALL